MDSKRFKSVDDILDFAIAEEEGAARFYTELSQKVNKEGLQMLLLGFAAEEQGHRAKLLEIKKGKHLLSLEGKVVDLKIADYLVDIMPTPHMDYQDALILAMKKEKAAFKMYTDLAEQAPTPELRHVLLGLAQEEAKHKLHFELQYDDNVLTEN